MKPEGGKEPIKSPKPVEKKKEEAKAAAPATIIVSLPASAKLTFDGVATKSTSATRVFATPTLDTDKEYYYTLNGELTQNGQTVTASKRIVVRSGEETRVSFEFPVTTLAQR